MRHDDGIPDQSRLKLEAEVNRSPRTDTHPIQTASRLRRLGILQRFATIGLLTLLSLWLLTIVLVHTGPRTLAIAVYVSAQADLAGSVIALAYLLDPLWRLFSFSRRQRALALCGVMLVTIGLAFDVHAHVASDLNWSQPWWLSDVGDLTMVLIFVLILLGGTMLAKEHAQRDSSTG